MECARIKESKISYGKINVSIIKKGMTSKAVISKSKIGKASITSAKIEIGMFYSPTKSQLQYLRSQLGQQFQLDSNLFLSQQEIQYESQYPFWKIFASIGITVTGIISFLIPGIGYIVGSAITSAGVTGIVSCFSNPDISWTQLFKQIGIQALVSLATSSISDLGSAANILNNSMFQSGIKGALIGALTSSSTSLIRMGFDPKLKFQWSSVLIHSIIGSISAMHKFKVKHGKDEELAKQKYWKDLKQKLGAHISDKKQTVNMLNQRWNFCYYKLSKQQQRMFPELAPDNYTAVHNQGLVHFLDYNVIEDLVKEKGGRLQHIAQIVGASVQPEKGVVNGFLPHITKRLDQVVSKLSPAQITVIGQNNLKETLKFGVDLGAHLLSLKNCEKVPWGVTKIYYFLRENAEKGLKVVTYMDLRTKIEKYSTLIPKNAKEITKQLKKLII